MIRRKRLPPVVWSRRRMLAIPGFVLWIAGLVLMAGPVPWRTLTNLLWLYVGVGALAILGAAMFVREWKLRKIVIEHKGRVCPACAYPLLGQERQTRCPECGTTVDLERAVEQWREFVVW